MSNGSESPGIGYPGLAKPGTRWPQANHHFWTALLVDGKRKALTTQQVANSVRAQLRARGARGQR